MISEVHTRSVIGGIIQATFAAEAIHADVTDALAGCHEAVVNLVRAQRARSGAKPTVVGICGAQGSGKSAFARILSQVLHELEGLDVAVLSLDDLYLSRAQRSRLGTDVHPLLATRTVPGTHDVQLGIDVITRLTATRNAAGTRLPHFNKARDEPWPIADQPVLEGPVDVVIFEGWCVGARAQDETALHTPVNEFERSEDPNGIWRRFVNEQLRGPYQTLFALIDLLVLLRAPRFERVIAWRQEQEHKLAAKLPNGGSAPGSHRIMSDEEIIRFVMQCERLTRHILAEMPDRADLVIDLDEDRRVVRTGERRQIR